MESIMYRDPELEASFSFNSAFHVFSDNDDDDEYIEIALEQQPKINTFEEDELELRISFSSSSYNHYNIGLSRTSTVEEWEITTTTTTTTPTSFCSSSTTSTLTCSSAETCWVVDDQPSRRAHKSTAVKRRVQYFRAVSRLLSGFFSTPSTSSAPDEGDGVSHESRQAEIRTKTSQLNLSSNRRSAAKNVITKATNGGIMMKFLIKCRSMNIRSVLASLMKPYQVIISSPQSNGISSAGQTKKRSNETTAIRRNQQSLPVKPFDKWLVQREKQNPEDYKSTNYCSSSSSNYSSPPPVQQGYAGDSCSVQAAIAHCKRSFGQTSEFHF